MTSVGQSCQRRDKGNWITPLGCQKLPQISFPTSRGGAHQQRPCLWGPRASVAHNESQMAWATAGHPELLMLEVEKHRSGAVSRGHRQVQASSDSLRSALLLHNNLASISQPDALEARIHLTEF